MPARGLGSEIDTSLASFLPSSLRFTVCYSFFSLAGFGARPINPTNMRIILRA